MTAAVIASAAALLLVARWALNLRRGHGDPAPPRFTDEEELPAEARRAQERARDLGAAAGHLWAWRDLLSDVAAAGGSSGEGEGDGRHGVGGGAGADAAEGRIRTALAGLGLSRVESPARSVTRSGGSAPWLG
ncbi:hypothetical protein HUT17_02305 [Nocardiopsis flavescens]|nr:hypothetical protein HUT17_02305 [Nocardiopsis flavescens]